MTLTQEQVDRVRSLEDADGRLTPEMVVEDARRKDSPLHDLFEWDKSKAAMMTWLHQARVVIGAVRIAVTTTTSTVKAPVYVHDPDADGQGYRSVVSLRKDPEKALESLRYTLEIACGHLRRALDLAEQFGLQGEIDALLEQIVGLQRTLTRAA